MRFLTILFASVLIFLTVQLASADDQVSLRRLLAQPNAFRQASVSTSGLAYIDGDRFVLFQDVRAAKTMDLRRAISVAVSAKQDYGRFNRWWIEITGIVAPDDHGPHFGGFACGITLKSAKPLYKEKEKLWLTDLGEFRNATGIPVEVRLTSTQGGAVFELAPNGWNSVAVKTGSVAVSTLAGHLLFTSRLSIPPRTGRPDEPEDRTYTFVFDRKGIVRK